MEEQTRETEIRLQDFLAIFKRCWWQMLIVLIVVAVAMYVGLTATHDDMYTATASIYVMSLPTDEDGLNTQVISVAANLINDCEELIESHEQILRPVMVSQNLEGVIEIEMLEEMFSATRAENARVLYLSITSINAESSAKIVNALSEQACTYFNNLYMDDLLSVVDHATVPDTPSNPISLLTILLVAFVFAVLVYGIHFIRFILDDKINNAEDVEKYLGLSMLGVIPNKYDTGRKKSKYGYYYSYTADGDRKRQ